MANIESIKNEESGLSARTKINSAIVEANKVDQKLSAGVYTAADVKAKYESNPDTNAFTDASLAKLNGIDPSAYATAEQGQKADSALQPDDVSLVATTGDYGDLNEKPILGTMAAQEAGDYTPTESLGSAAFSDSDAFATSAQGALADTAVQPGVLGSAAYSEATAFASAAQGALADSATQPADLASVATSGSYEDLTATPTLGTAASADTVDFATAAQGSKADSAAQAVGFTTIAVVTDLPAVEDPDTIYIVVPA